jgi:hypothetical protein
MDDLSRFSCLNSECPDHGERGVGNLSLTSRYGPDKARRMLRCGTCKARFSERKGTVLFGARLSHEQVETVLEHVAEGCGVRQTSRLCKVNHWAHRRQEHDHNPRWPPATATSPVRPPRGSSGPTIPHRSDARRRGPDRARPARRRGSGASGPCPDKLCDADAVRGEILRQALREVDVGRLGGAVRRVGRPATDATKTIVPVARSTMRGASEWPTWIIPMTFTRSTRSQSYGQRLVNGKPNLPEPIAATWAR